MTRTEAIHILDNLKPTNTKSSFDAYVVGNALTMAIEALENKSPCDLCRYNPPGSGDGKPCTMCPAVGKDVAGGIE